MTDRAERSGPLNGVRVVALEQAVAMPLATRYMADLGADVIKIERPDGGDFARHYDSHVRGQSTYFVWLNRGKRSITLDLKRQAARDIARALAGTVDVFVQNLATGAAGRLGLGPEVLMAANSRLVYGSISGYGTTGPYAGRKAYDLLIQGESGAATVSGTPEQPAKIGISVVDIAGGMHVLTGVLAALLERGATGTGKKVEVTLLDAIGEWMHVPYLYAEHTGGRFPRSGQRHNMIAPYGPFACRDGAVNLAIQNQREWRRFCSDVLGDERFADDGRFAHNKERIANVDSLTAAIEAVFAEMTAEELSRRLDAAGIPYGIVRDPGQAAAHPQFAARERWAEHESPGGPIRLLKLPLEAEGWGSDGAAVPALGQHTDEVLRGLGLTDGAIAELRTDGAI